MSETRELPFTAANGPAPDPETLSELLVHWRNRRKEYEAEHRDAAARHNKHDRLSAADIWGELGVCIHELEDVIAKQETK